MNIRLPATLFSSLLLLLSILPAGRLVAGGGAAPFDPHHPMHDGSLSGSSIAVSDDDDRWDSRFGFPGVEGQVYTIAVEGDQVYIGGSFRYVQNVEANNIVRFDSRTGTFHALGAGTNNHVHSIEVASNGDVYIGGEFTLIGEDTMRGIARWDGARWHRFGSGISGGVGHYGSCVWSIRSVGDLLYIGGDFDSIDGSNINGLAAWDRVTGRWSALGDGTSGIVYALDTLGGDLYAAGELTRAGILLVGNIARWNGSDWSILGQGSRNGVDAAVLTLESANGFLYVGGSFDLANGDSAHRIARWDGSRWTSLGSGLTGGWGWRSGTVFDIEEQNGELYAGGAFSSHDNLARWNGFEWERIGQGVVFALGLVDTTLFVGGEFREENCRYLARWFIPSKTWECFASGIVAERVATIVAYGDDLYAGGEGIRVWNSVRNEWSSISGIDGTVSHLATDNGYLYAAGTLRRTGSDKLVSLARWSFASRSWEPLLEDAGSWLLVQAMAIRDSLLYIGGTSASFGGRWFYGVNRLNLRTGVWSILGEPDDMLPDVRALAFLGEDLVAGGSFDPGGRRLRNIARWDGSRWLPLGNGLPGDVHTLAVSGSRLYAAGDFDTLGFSIVNHIASWENNVWSGLEGGVYTAGDSYEMVGDMIADGDDLYVGGYFNRAGTTVVSNIARWNALSRVWSPLGSGIDNEVYALSIAGGSLFAGGGFQNAGKRPSVGIARWELERVTAAPEPGTPAARSRFLTLHQTSPDLLEIALTLPDRRPVTLELFDGLGRHVTTLLDGERGSEKDRIALDTEGLASGRYLLRLVAGRTVETSLIVIAR